MHERQEKEALIRVYKEFFPAVSEFNEVPLTDNENTPTVQTVTKMTAEDGSLLGYCLGCSAKGYKGAIALTVAFDAQGNLLGVRIGSHGETASLGARISEEWFYSQYTGKTLPVELKTDIEAITGATISSRAVTDAVNEAGVYAATLSY